MSTITTAHADCTALKQSLAALQAGQEQYAQFVAGLLAELEATQQKLARAETQMELQNGELSELRNRQPTDAQVPVSNIGTGDEALQSKVVELESDRQALEEELENIRTRAVEMAQIITDQKRQMADDQSQWMAEFRQLRRILDKQTKWITQQTEMGGLPSTGTDGPRNAEIPLIDGSGAAEFDSETRALQPPEHAGRTPGAAFNPAPSHQGAGNTADPVLGSVLSQFEFLQKDVARRRKQGGTDRMSKKASPPEKLNN